MELNSILDGADLRIIHTIATLVGAMLAVYVMQLWGTGEIGNPESLVFVHLRRIALAGLALAFLWSLAYSDNKGWQPWPPDLIAVIAMDIFLGSTVISAIMRRRKDHSDELDRSLPPTS